MNKFGGGFSILCGLMFLVAVFSESGGFEIWMLMNMMLGISFVVAGIFAFINPKVTKYTAMISMVFCLLYGVGCLFDNSGFEPFVWAIFAFIVMITNFKTVSKKDLTDS